MGRRLSILMGLVLILACPLARSQDQKTEGTPTRNNPAGSLPPVTPAEPADGADPKAREAAPALAIPAASELPVQEPAAAVDAGTEVKDPPR